VPGWWQVCPKAIAMLDGVTRSRKSPFRETVGQVFANPQASPREVEMGVTAYGYDFCEAEASAAS
jgi:hypothetical protein